PGTWPAGRARAAEPEIPDPGSAPPRPAPLRPALARRVPGYPGTRGRPQGSEPAWPPEYRLDDRGPRPGGGVAVLLRLADTGAAAARAPARAVPAVPHRP